MQSMFLPLRLATDARNLELVIDLDMNIDDIARRAVYQASGQSNESITRRLEERPSGENHWGTVLGDEMRLRQIVTNLASNACKFTPSGGKLTVTTRLVAPPLATRFREPNYGSKRQARSSPNRSPSLASLQFNPEMPEQIIVRIEVSDTGSGIHPNEMAQSNLFSAFNQTEKGRQQGGKGTGLGLALVRHIVQLSGGRLGLRSKVGVGSTFWVELPLGIGSRVLDSSNSGISRTPTPVSASRPDNSILPSRHITPRISDANVDLPSKMTSPVPCPRSSSALHGLMDQGGSVELILPRYNSYSKIPTRTLGDASTGTDYPCPGTEHDYYPPRRYVDSLVPRSIHSAVIPLPDSLADCADHQITFGLSNLRIDQPPTPLAVEGPSVKGAVLVVDDDHLTRALMSRLLKRMGYSVITAENGRVALDILLGSDIPTKSGANNHEIGQKFLAVFMDNQMPVMSGHEAVTTLRSQGRKDFVVGVTGNALLSDQKVRNS
ncbi:hypothetical protein AX16_008132 [Volvariella volvacea WC 439]|nr:hypothetical protein AX16_008132 [Volvariella volvacea WC 439]